MVPALDGAGAVTMPAAIEATTRELGRWQQRERRILDALKVVEAERHRLDEELVKVQQQVTYYDSLARDMKRELGRPGLSSLLASFRRP